jgi:hypothetical protein
MGTRRCVSLLREVVDGECVGALRCELVRACRNQFQAYSFIRLRSRVSSARARARCPAEAVQPRRSTTLGRLSVLQQLTAATQQKKRELCETARDEPKVSRGAPEDHSRQPASPSEAKLAEGEGFGPLGSLSFLVSLGNRVSQSATFTQKPGSRYKTGTVKLTWSRPRSKRRGGVQSRARDFRRTSRCRSHPRSAGSRKFGVDLPANHRGPGWKRRAGRPDTRRLHALLHQLAMSGFLVPRLSVTRAASSRSRNRPRSLARVGPNSLTNSRIGASPSCR